MGTAGRLAGVLPGDTLPPSYLLDSWNPCPIQAKSRPMPVHDGARSDQDERPGPPRDAIQEPAGGLRMPRQRDDHGHLHSAKQLKCLCEPSQKEVLQLRIWPREANVCVNIFSYF